MSQILPSIDLFLKGQSELLSVNCQQFEEHLNVQWLPTLSFFSPRLQRKIGRKCHRAHKRGEFARKQIWLGTHFEKEIAAGVNGPLFIGWVDDLLQYGAFAKKKILAGHFIGEYSGIVRKSKKGDRENEYCFEYAIGDVSKSPYLIDAKEQGNYTRFINHSEKKANLEHLAVLSAGALHIILVANKTIGEGEELRYDYGDAFWKGHRHSEVVTE